jgi:hypothetical protein
VKWRSTQMQKSEPGRNIEQKGNQTISSSHILFFHFFFCFVPCFKIRRYNKCSMESNTWKLKVCDLMIHKILRSDLMLDFEDIIAFALCDTTTSRIFFSHKYHILNSSCQISWLCTFLNYRKLIICMVT